MNWKSYKILKRIIVQYIYLHGLGVVFSWDGCSVMFNCEVLGTAVRGSVFSVVVKNGFVVVFSLVRVVFIVGLVVFPVPMVLLGFVVTGSVVCGSVTSLVVKA